MKQPENPSCRKITNDWVNKAHLDIRSAKALLAQDHPLLYPSCFHSQQAAEKYIKSLLTWWDIEVPKTHELGKLLKMIESRDAKLAARLFDVVVLNTYAVDIRYPGDQPEPSLEESREALKLAQQVRDAILPLMPNLRTFGETAGSAV